MTAWVSFLTSALVKEHTKRILGDLVVIERLLPPIRHSSPQSTAFIIRTSVTRSSTLPEEIFLSAQRGHQRDLGEPAGPFYTPPPNHNNPKPWLFVRYNPAKLKSLIRTVRLSASGYPAVFYGVCTTETSLAYFLLLFCRGKSFLGFITPYESVIPPFWLTVTVCTLMYFDAGRLCQTPDQHRTVFLSVPFRKRPSISTVLLSTLSVALV